MARVSSSMIEIAFLCQWVAYRRALSQLTVTVSGANSAAILSTTL